MLDKSIIFKKLLNDSDYFTKVFPFLQKDDFSDQTQKELFELIGDTYIRYNKSPTLDEVALIFDVKGMDTTKRQLVHAMIHEIKDAKVPEIDTRIMVDETEKAIMLSRFERVLREGIDIIDGTKDISHLYPLVPKVENAIGTSFHSSLGHDYNDEWEHRLEEYGKRDTEGISTGIQKIDMIVGGKGFQKKTLTVAVSGINGGKTLFLVSSAVSALFQGKNVAFFSNEVSEIEISRRADSNVTNTTMDDLVHKNIELRNHFSKVFQRAMGKMKVKEYPTGTATVLNYKQALREWKMKDNFVPDIIVVDYLQIMKSLHSKQSDNSYSEGKRVAEELRSLAVEFDVPVVTAAQLDRKSQRATSDVGMDNTGESLGIPATADAMIAVLFDPTMPDHRICINLKSRYVDKAKMKPFLVKMLGDYTRLEEMEDGDNVDMKKMKQASDDLSEIETMMKKEEESEEENSEDPLQGLMSMGGRKF